MKLYPNHLIGTKELSKDDILELVDIAGSFRKVLNQTVKSLPTLRGKTVVNLFLKILQERGYLLNLLNSG